MINTATSPSVFSKALQSLLFSHLHNDYRTFALSAPSQAEHSDLLEAGYLVFEVQDTDTDFKKVGILICDSSNNREKINGPFVIKPEEVKKQKSVLPKTEHEMKSCTSSGGFLLLEEYHFSSVDGVKKLILRFGTGNAQSIEWQVVGFDSHELVFEEC